MVFALWSFVSQNFFKILNKNLFITKPKALSETTQHPISGNGPPGNTDLWKNGKPHIPKRCAIEVASHNWSWQVSKGLKGFLEIFTPKRRKRKKRSWLESKQFVYTVVLTQEPTLLTDNVYKNHKNHNEKLEVTHKSWLRHNSQKPPLVLVQGFCSLQ